MELLQHLHIHTGSVVVTFREAAADDFNQVGIPRIILRQQHQMVVPILSAGQLSVKSGTGRHVDFTADNGIDSCRRGLLIELDDAVHNAMVCDGRTVHAQLFHTLDILFDLVGTV